MEAPEGVVGTRSPTSVAFARRQRNAIETAMEFATRSADNKEPQRVADVFDKTLQAAANYEERTNTDIILATRSSSQRRLAIIILAFITAGAGAGAFALFYFLSSALGIPFLVIAGTSGGFIPVLATQQNVTVEQAGRMLRDVRKSLGSSDESDEPDRRHDPSDDPRTERGRIANPSPPPSVMLIAPQSVTPPDSGP